MIERDEASEYWEAIPVTLTGKDVLTMVGVLDCRIEMIQAINSDDMAREINAPSQEMRDRLMDAVKAAQTAVESARKGWGRDQQVTLAMCNEAVFDINPVDPDFGLIDKEQVERALAQLPWPHGSGETPPHFEGKAIMQGTAPVVHQGKGTALYASPDDAASTQDAPTEVEDGLDVSCRYGDILRRVPDGIAEMGRVRMSSRERAVDAINRAIDEGSGSVDQFSIAWDAIGWIESAGLQIVPANLLDAVIAAVEMTEIPWKGSQEWRKKDIIAAIRAAWEGETDGD